MRPEQCDGSSVHKGYWLWVVGWETIGGAGSFVERDTY